MTVARLLACTFGMEARSGARQFAGFGHTVHAFSPGRIDPKPCGRV
ncbi:MAG: hypothetical protein RL489_1507 [Pseudomonadota bacterium]